MKLKKANKAAASERRQFKRPASLTKLPRPRLPRRRKGVEESLEQAISTLPRITNETVAEHREEVLSSARKYIYPLKHSARRIVMISTSLFVVAIIALFTYTMLELYKFNSTSGFMYAVTQIVPLPVARAGSHFVSYESYLFELRHYVHYYQTQQKVDFNSTSGKQQLAVFRKQALQSVINDAYVKELATQHNIRVTDQELNDEITLVRDQNRLGGNNQVFSDVLKEFWGWSVDDFKRELRQEMLAQKVVSTLDTATQQRAKSVHAQLLAGADFGNLAKQYSDDLGAKDTGGEYGTPIDPSNRDISPQVIDQLFKLKPGQTSDIINTGSSLEIVKLESLDNGKARAEHIVFNLKNINAYIDPLSKREPAHSYIHF